MKNLKTQLASFSMLTGGLLLCVYGSGKFSNNNDVQKLKDAQEVIKKGNPDKYSEMMKQGTTYRNWFKEAERVRDSLQVDSLCKKAYFEGAQMVRDSIKNAAKVIK